MKHKYKFVFLLCILSACKKNFLEVPDKSVLLRQAYVKDLKTSSEYLNGLYTQLAGFYDGYNFIYPELIADNIKPAVTNTGILVPHYNWDQKGDNQRKSTVTAAVPNMNPLYATGYSIITNTNFIIDEVDKYQNENKEKAQDIKGQGLALRALLHFILVNVFAQPYGYTSDASHFGIVYKKSANVTDNFPRSSVAEVYANIEDDLRSAIELLPTNPTTVPLAQSALVINKKAAKALLARVLLFEGDFQQSKNLAREILTIVPLMKTPQYPSKLFTADETEALFQLPPAWVGAGAGNYQTFFAAVYMNNGAQTQFLATTNMASLLTSNPADVRRSWIKSGGVGKDTISKYPVSVVAGFPRPSLSYYQTILRSSEMSLTAAEAYAKLGSDDSARIYLDAVRMRANSTLKPITASGNALLDSIYLERRKELAFEGLRMFDLLRAKRGVTRTDATTPGTITLSYPSNKAIAPLPTSEIQLLGFEQNPEY